MGGQAERKERIEKPGREREGEEGGNEVNMIEAVNLPQTSTDTDTETVTH